MIPKCRKYNEGSSVGTGSGKRNVTNRGCPVHIYRITRFRLSLGTSFLLSLPGCLFLLLPAHGKILPPHQPWLFIPSNSFIQQRDKVSICQIPTFRKVKRLVSGNQVSTQSSRNIRSWPTWPDFWERGEGSFFEEEPWDEENNGFSLWDKWLLSDGVGVKGFLTPLPSACSVLWASVPFGRTKNFLTKVQATNQSGIGLNDGLQDMSWIYHKTCP